MKPIPTEVVHSIVVNKCNGATIQIDSAPMPFILEVKIFNDSVAFRYLINQTDLVIKKKKTPDLVFLREAPCGRNPT
jgi:hypothetical protein